VHNAVEQVRYRINRVFELDETGDLEQEAFRERMEALVVERWPLDGEMEALSEDEGGKQMGASDYNALRCSEKHEFVRASVRAVVVHEKSAELVLSSGSTQDVHEGLARQAHPGP
jgi:hypothetical protein